MLIVLICITGIYFAQPVLIPLILASLVSILLNPIVDFLHHKMRLPQVVAVLVTIAISSMLVALVLLLMSRQVSSVSDDWPQIKSHVLAIYQDLQNWVRKTFHISYRKQQSYIQEAADELLQNSRSILGSTLGTFSSVMIKLVLALIYTILILVYRNLFLTFLYKKVNPQYHVVLHNIVHQIKTVVGGYIIGLILEMLIVAFMLWIGLVIIGVKYALFLAAFAAILNLIPYIGIWVGALVAMAFTLGTSAEFRTILEVLALYILTHLVDANFLITKVVSSKVKINALTSMLGVIIGASLMGIWGTFLALPVIAVMKVIFDRVPALEPWGYLMGDEVPKEFTWDAPQAHEIGTVINKTSSGLQEPSGEIASGTGSTHQ
jgi:predicted PurR-regulated permease PerM